VIRAIEPLGRAPIRRALAIRFKQDIDRHPARDLSAFVSADAVSNCKHHAVGTLDEMPTRVVIVRASRTDIGQQRQLEACSVEGGAEGDESIWNELPSYTLKRKAMHNFGATHSEKNQNLESRAKIARCIRTLTFLLSLTGRGEEQEVDGTAEGRAAIARGSPRDLFAKPACSGSGRLGYENRFTLPFFFELRMKYHAPYAPQITEIATAISGSFALPSPSNGPMM